MPTQADNEARLAALERLVVELQVQLREREQENQVLRDELEEWKQGVRTRSQRQRRRYLFSS